MCFRGTLAYFEVIRSCLEGNYSLPTVYVGVPTAYLRCKRSLFGVYLQSVW